MSKMNITRGSGSIVKPSTTANSVHKEVRKSVADARAAGRDQDKLDNAQIKKVKTGKIKAPTKTKGDGGKTGGTKAKPHKVKEAASAQQPPTTPSGIPATDNNVGPDSGMGLHGYRWNLPPHKWSLPVEPSDNSFAVNTESYILGSLPPYRRGRIYFYSRIDSSKVNTATYNTGKGTDNKTGHALDPRYGFQFLWNPETFTTSVAVNMDITPTWRDSFVNVVGAFPSGEYLNVQFRIDRTNDFACIKSLPSNIQSNKNVDVYARYADSYGQYYNGAGNLGFDNFNSKTGQNLGEKIIELQRYGTIADLEYLYKAINGPGWKNRATGKDTSDIGFLMPTLLRIDIGPLSYLGYVNNMTVNHIAFNKGMVPIRTDVSLQFNLMATAGLSSK